MLELTGRRQRTGVRPDHWTDAAESLPERARVTADGKFFALDGRPFRLRGVTYGTFAPRRDRELFPEPDVVERDFLAMADAGLNTIRVYTLPPTDVLDLAASMRLRLLVGVHYTDWREEAEPGRRAARRILESGRRAVGAALERCADRPEVIAISVGNEIPADLVRLHGIGSVQETLASLVATVHEGGSHLLATYTSYPTTEYLRADGQDFASFNVFLESPDDFEAYLRHLQVVAGDLPLVITETGLASDIHGVEAQAEVLAWQLRIVEETGCAGATIFSWTDEWAVGGRPVEAWGFGVTDTARRPRPALDVTRAWTASDVRSLRSRWPKVSVVVCARNEEALVGRCLESLRLCDYPDLDVVFCDDGSTDRTLDIARTFPFRVLALDHGGLSRARNAGLEAAEGTIVAFLDADAECHPEWPYYLALSLEEDGVAATGGPNLPPAGAPFAERAIAESPGGPIHVLLSDDRAEHVPGCNMAFRKDVLEEVGGFDPVFTAAGDDVHVCWNLLDSGYEIAFAPTAQVRHHRPATFGTYLRQQRSYGRSERLLQGRHPHRFNRIGQARWAGSIYGGPRVLPRLLRPIIYHGWMGTAPFQPVARHRSEVVRDHVAALLPLTALLLAAGALAPLSLWALTAPAVALAILVSYGTSIAAALDPPRTEPHRLRLRLAVGLLHVAQPFARTWGRLRGRAAETATEPSTDWSGDRTEWLLELKRDLRARRCKVWPGKPHEPFDLAVSVGPLVKCRVWTAVAWNWLPCERTDLRLRAAAIGGLLLGIALLPLSLWGGVAVLGTVILVAVMEAILVSRAVRSAVRRTAVDMAEGS
jgi:GT2 family glycosyltransferase